MIRHDSVTEYLMAFLVEDSKKVVYGIIGIRFLDEVQPPVTGKGDEVNTGSFNWCMNRHVKR